MEQDGLQGSHPQRVRVVCAVLRNGDKYYIAQRPEGGSGAYQYEFPGGKIEPGESPEQALSREIQEELSIQIQIDSYLGESEFDYGTKKICLLAFLCTKKTGEIVLTEHMQGHWVSLQEMKQYPMAPADVPFIQKLEKLEEASS